MVKVPVEAGKSDDACNTVTDRTISVGVSKALRPVEVSETGAGVLFLEIKFSNTFFDALRLYRNSFCLIPFFKTIFYIFTSDVVLLDFISLDYVCC